MFIIGERKGRGRGLKRASVGNLNQEGELVKKRKLGVRWVLRLIWAVGLRRSSIWGGAGEEKKRGGAGNFDDVFIVGGDEYCLKGMHKEKREKCLGGGEREKKRKKRRAGLKGGRIGKGGRSPE